ncbi:predicted protein [Naegleria gruberi]|uniref:Predicted protein n=1 Tax=Naegleria gruberi TaxID=5762 RepID=D2VBM0_NAEGR|nr:uncharacterized protein NAEGRDRAFT_66263 [Naegleria gruberi]EFC45932.1 predicted protein [Naegleria gruberi]|eukprot:XP_002678676.1 predicted protein [Naegleria gruberi strain NEG-M]
MSNNLISVPCFDCTFSECFNNAESFPDVIFETLEGKIYAHKFMLYQNRYFKNLFDVHEKVLTPRGSSSGTVSNSSILTIPIQEPLKIFKSLIEYFYSGVVNCQVNDLSEFIMMAYRFKIINLITVLKKILMGEAATQIIAKTKFEKTEILNLPENTKMTMENALSLFGEVCGNSVLETTVFKTEITLAKRVILKSVCFSLLFSSNTTIEKMLKFSVNSMNELLLLIAEHLDLIKAVQKYLVDVSIINTPLNMKEIIKFTLKWMCYMKSDRLISISDLYETLNAIEKSIQQPKEVAEFIKSIEVMRNMASKNQNKHQHANSDTSDHQNATENDDSNNRKRVGSTLVKLKSMYSSPSQKNSKDEESGGGLLTTSGIQIVREEEPAQEQSSLRRMKRTSTFIQPKVNY